MARCSGVQPAEVLLATVAVGSYETGQAARWVSEAGRGGTCVDIWARGVTSRSGRLKPISNFPSQKHRARLHARNFQEDTYNNRDVRGRDE